MSSLLYDDTSHPSLLVKLLWLCPKNPRPIKGHIHPKHVNGASVVILPKSSPRWGPYVTSMLQPCPKDIWYYQVFFKWTIERSQLDLMPLQSGENSKLVGSPLIFENFNYWRAPKLLDRFRCEFGVKTTKEQGVGAHSLARNTLGVEGHDGIPRRD
jgi:hypothetical protein